MIYDYTSTNWDLLKERLINRLNNTNLENKTTEQKAIEIQRILFTRHKQKKSN